MTWKIFLVFFFILPLLLLGGGVAAAQQTVPEGGTSGQTGVQTSAPQAQAQESKPARNGLAIGLIAIGAALAVGICALGTGLAQSRIGAAGAGTIAEKPDTAGTIILLVAIPETMLILGFVVAIVMIFTL
jgi:V/A-type H+-transporting ATPase subunit K